MKYWTAIAQIHVNDQTLTSPGANQQVILVEQNSQIMDYLHVLIDPRGAT